MAVARHAHDLLVDVPLKALRVVGHLDKAAALQHNARVLARDLGVVGDGLVVLDIAGLIRLKQTHERLGLLAGTHIVTHERGIGGGGDDAVRVDHIDLRHVELNHQHVQFSGSYPALQGIQSVRDLTRQLQQVMVGCVEHIHAHILNVQAQQLSGVVL